MRSIPEKVAAWRRCATRPVASKKILSWLKGCPSRSASYAQVFEVETDISLQATAKRPWRVTYSDDAEINGLTAAKRQLYRYDANARSASRWASGEWVGTTFHMVFVSFCLVSACAASQVRRARRVIAFSSALIWPSLAVAD